MSQLERAFRAGKEVVAERHGEFNDEPEDFELQSGLLENHMAAHTQSSIPTDREGAVLIYDSDAYPHTITVDEELAETYPDRATKSLLHELYEWRAAEVMPSDEVLRGNTDYVAEFNENSICREVNERLGEEVCDVSWNSEYDT